MNAKQIIDFLPTLAAIFNTAASNEATIVKLVRLAERLIPGSGKGAERLAFVKAILREARPALLAGADRLEIFERKVAVAVIYLKDIDANDSGLDDFVAEKLEVVVRGVDRFGEFVRKVAKKLPASLETAFDSDEEEPFTAFEDFLDGGE